MNKCDLPMTLVLCVCVCACVCVSVCSSFNEWEPVSHQTGVLIVRSPELKLRMSATMSHIHTHTTQTITLSLSCTHTHTHHAVCTGQAVISQESGFRSLFPGDSESRR